MIFSTRLFWKKAALPWKAWKPTVHRLTPCHNLLALILVLENTSSNGREHKRIQLTAFAVTLGPIRVQNSSHFTSNSHSSTSCQLFTLSLWGGSSGFSQKRRNCCFASDLLKSLLCARLWQRLPILTDKQGNFTEELLEPKL